MLHSIPQGQMFQDDGSGSSFKKSQVVLMGIPRWEPLLEGVKGLEMKRNRMRRAAWPAYLWGAGSQMLHLILAKALAGRSPVSPGEELSHRGFRQHWRCV